MLKIKNNFHETKCDYAIDKDSNDVFFFMHGYISSNVIWDFVTPKIKGSKIMIPLMAHANSNFLGKNSYDMILVIDHIFNQLNEKLNLQKKRKILVVHSIAAAITLHYLNNYKNIFDKIIFVSPAVSIKIPFYSPLFYLLNFLSYDNLDLFWDLTFSKTRETLDNQQWFKEIFITGGTKHHFLPEKCSPEWVNKYYDSIIYTPESLKLLAKSARNTYSDPKDSLYNSSQEIEQGKLKNKFDCLTIVSMHDVLIPKDIHELNHKYMDGKIVYFKESSHMPMVEESEKFIETINEFVC